VKTERPVLTKHQALKNLSALTREYLEAAAIHSACTLYDDEAGAEAANRMAEKVYPKLMAALADADKALQ